MQFGFRRIAPARVDDLGLRRERGEQITCVVSDNLDHVLTGIERKFPLYVKVGTCTWGWVCDAGCDAVDAPFDAPDALAAIPDAGRDHDKVSCRSAVSGRGENSNRGGRSTVENLVQIDDFHRALDLALGIARDRLMNEIRIEEGLVNLTDRYQLKPAHHAEKIGAFEGGRKETGWRHCEPSARFAHERDGLAPCLRTAKLNGAIRSTEERAAHVRGESDTRSFDIA